MVTSDTSASLSSKLLQGGGPLLHLHKAFERQSREVPGQLGGCEPPGFWHAELSALHPPSLMLILLSCILANALLISLV